MKKKKLVFLAFATIAIALLLEAGILKYVNDSNTYRMSKVLLDRVITVLNKNDDSENGLIESLKDDYIVRAKAVSYIIDAKPQVEYDVEELQKIADLILVDEIHLFDKNGYIYSGTLPKYYGFSFDSGEQMEYFKPMLKNKNLTMCQDVTPNTAEGKELMYAITWNEAGTRMIQIGIEPKRLLKELKQNEISAVVSDMPVYKGIEIFVADSETKIVKGATDSRQIGVKLEGLVVSSDKKSGETDVRLIRIGGKRCKCLLSQYDDYIVAVTIDSSFYRQGNIFAVLIVGVYLVLASCCMLYMLSRVMKEKYEKEKTFYVRTENLEDQIEYIKINGAKQKSEKQKGLYECKVDEAKAYEVEVKAKDLAGNEQISRIGFEIEQEKTLLQKITEPVKKYIFYGNEKVIQDEKMVKEDKKEEQMNKRNGKSILCSGIMLTGMLTGIGFWKRERLGNKLKKMQPDNKNK